MNKVYTITAIVMIFCLLTFPLVSISESDNVKPVGATIASATQETTTKAPLTTKKVSDGTLINIYRSSSKKVEQIKVLDYLIGVVSGEMPASYEVEAIKAQAVAAYTILLRRIDSNKDKDYDITDDFKVDQAFLSESERKQKWGSNFNTYEEKMSHAVKSVLYQKITYKGEIINAVYHAISGGKTEDSKNVWGSEYPYLKSVESISDMLSPDYATKVTYSKDEFASLATNLKIKLKGDPAKWVGEKSTTEIGTVKSIKLGSETFKGIEVRTAFNLRSSDFDITYTSEKFVFSVRGYGHGVGMSQYGANVMAGQGSDYKEILKYYYTGVEISS